MAEPEAIDRKVKRGREFADVLVFSQDAKNVAKPVKGAYQISMRQGLRFAGDPVKSLETLSAAFPGCTFAWKK